MEIKGGGAIAYLTGKRVKTSMYVDEYLRDEFKKTVKNQGSDICEVLEYLMFTYLRSLRALEQVNLPKQLPHLEQQQININIQAPLYRRLTRPRRGGARGLETWGDHLTCFICGRKARVVVHYQEGQDSTIRVYCCGYHKRVYQSMKSYEQGFPKIRMRDLY